MLGLPRSPLAMPGMVLVEKQGHKFTEPQKTPKSRKNVSENSLGSVAPHDGKQDKEGDLGIP